MSLLYKSEGNLELRKKIKDYYRSFNINITTKEIIISTGASEALSFAMASIMMMTTIPEPFMPIEMDFILQTE